MASSQEDDFIPELTGGRNGGYKRYDRVLTLGIFYYSKRNIGPVPAPQKMISYR